MGVEEEKRCWRRWVADRGRWAGCALVIWCCLQGGAALAQEAALLEQAERLADRGEVQQARQALARWESDFGESAALDQKARAWLLSARLADDAAAAELDYLRVVVEGSTTPYADDALLRLAQYKFAEGDHSRTIEYLGRLRRDYPTSEHAATALLWIARAAREQGDAERACSAADQGLREVSPTDTALDRSLRAEREECRALPRSYTVQVAAFKDEVAAQNMARQLLESGFDAWILNATPQDPLYRVRVGRDLVEGEAQALIDRLVVSGYSPFLVSQTRAAGGGD